MLTAILVDYKKGVLKELRLEVKSPSSFYKLLKTSWAINPLFNDMTGDHIGSDAQSKPEHLAAIRV